MSAGMALRFESGVAPLGAPLKNKSSCTAPVCPAGGANRSLRRSLLLEEAFRPPWTPWWGAEEDDDEGIGGGSESAFNPKRSAVPPAGESWAAGAEVWKERRTQDIKRWWECELRDRRFLENEAFWLCFIILSRCIINTYKVIQSSCLYWLAILVCSYLEICIKQWFTGVSWQWLPTWSRIRVGLSFWLITKVVLVIQGSSSLTVWSILRAAHIFKYK